MLGNVVDELEGRGIRPEHAVDLLLGPDIEAAFLPLAVGVERAGETGDRFAVGAQSAHLPQDPFDGFADARLE